MPEFNPAAHPLSASQVATFQSCVRRWSYKYIEHLPEDAGVGAASGSKVHKLLEDWLKDSKVPDGSSVEHIMARAMLPFLPHPPQKGVEQRFSFEVDGVTWRGAIDLAHWEDDTFIIHDHKSTSDLKWVKSKEVLQSDPQATIYSKYALATTDKIKLNWLYCTRSSNPQIQPVRLNVDAERVEAAFAELTTIGKRILTLYKERRPTQELPPDPTRATCFAYNKKCPYYDACQPSALTLQERLQQHNQKEDSMGFRDRNVVTPSTPPPAPSPTRVEASPAPAKATAWGQRLNAGFGDAVVPPSVVQEAADRVQAATQSKVISLEELDEKLDETMFPPPAAPAKPRGRPVGSKNKKTEVASLPEDQDVVVTTAVMPGAHGSPPEYTPEYTLYVNSRSSNDTDVVSFAYILSSVLPAVERVLNVADYRMADYGKGPGQLAAAVAEWLRRNQPSAVWVDARTDEGRHCLSTLERFAGTVVRGF